MGPACRLAYTPAPPRVGNRPAGLGVPPPGEGGHNERRPLPGLGSRCPSPHRVRGAGDRPRRVCARWTTPRRAPAPRSQDWEA
ncbi:hypothetical protein BN2537_13071 [Streptomyces venezuelae]|nr:hypothetical protein BN2537_13071 [Streptomyces venezuelae]